MKAENVYVDANWEAFQNLSREPEKVAKCLYLYLVNGGYGQMEVQSAVYDNEGYNYVSIICRAYNFKGKNQGRLSEKNLGGKVEFDDVLDFVKLYPNGIEVTDEPGNGKEMRGFLKERIAERMKYNEDYYDYDDYGDEYDEKMFSPVCNLSSSKYNHTSNQQTWSVQPAKSHRNHFSNQQTQSVQPDKNTNVNSDDFEVCVLVIGVIVLILFLGFNWFGLRTKLVKLIINILGYGWIIGLGVLLIALLIDKVPVDWVEGKGFVRKAIFFVLTGGVSFGILVFVLDILAKLL